MPHRRWPILRATTTSRPTRCRKSPGPVLLHRLVVRSGERSAVLQALLAEIPLSLRHPVSDRVREATLRPARRLVYLVPAAALVYLLAALSQSDILYLALAMLGGASLVSLFYAPLAVRGLGGSAQLLRTAPALREGDEVRVELTITNLFPVARGWLQVRADHAQGAWAPSGGDGSLFVPWVPAGRAVRVSWTVVVPRRGIYQVPRPARRHRGTLRTLPRRGCARGARGAGAGPAAHLGAASAPPSPTARRRVWRVPRCRAGAARSSVPAPTAAATACATSMRVPAPAGAAWWCANTSVPPVPR